MNRRRFIRQAAMVAGLPGAAALLPSPAIADEVATALPGASDVEPAGHSFEAVVELARALAAEPHQPIEVPLLPPFADLSPAAHGGITPDPAARIRLGGTPPVVVEPLPPGSVFRDPVRIDRVEGGRAEPVAFSPDFFRFDTGRFADLEVGADAMAAAADPAAGLGFSGFVLGTLPDGSEALDPVAVFQGASQFRARHRDGVWGASARGLAIGTGSSGGEEVPVFTRFWLHQMAEGERSLRLHALLDSPSVAGAYAFEIRPGAETGMVVRCRLFPRADLPQVGIAALNSMHLFGPHRRGGVDDLRDAVHDSDGLQIVTGRGERLWRPLSNPAALQLSGFIDDNPRAFGLAQRARTFDHYGDPAAGFERRPSVWVEPLGDWGRGQVVLVEIPLPSEVNDNIVAFWRPAGTLAAGGDYAFDYALTWGPLPPDAAPLARVVATRTGAAEDDARAVAVDFDRSAVPEGELEPRLSVSRGGFDGLALVATPEPGRVRVSFRFRPDGAELSEFRLVLYGADGAPASETWLHRWTPA
jgi:periplasmic glucans biosynthesis protein